MSREVRTYTDAEKLAYTVIALETPDGAAQLEAVHGVPHQTVSHWLADVGGIGEARRILNEKTQGALVAARQAVAYEIVRRISTLPDAELAETFRAMLPADKPDKGAVNVTTVVGQQTTTEYEVSPDAVAKALLTLHAAGALTNGHNNGA